MSNQQLLINFGKTKQFPPSSLDIFSWLFKKCDQQERVLLALLPEEVFVLVKSYFGSFGSQKDLEANKNILI